MVVTLGLFAAPTFDEHFLDETMRIDYFHIGDSQEEIVTVDRIYRQGTWAGSVTQLEDTFDNGRYYVKVYDEAGTTLLYSRGFDSYFGEYQTTEEAGKGIKRTYHESALIPFPRHKVLVTLESRETKTKILHRIFQSVIDPDAYTLNRDPLLDGVTVFPVHVSGDPHVKVDIAVVAEGYTAGEAAKVKKDLDRFRETLFSMEPYKSQTKDFNILGVFFPSAQSGCDEPSYGSYRATAVGTTFDSLGSERYLLTEDNRALRDIAAHVPYDTLFIMVNSDRYGGGGIYNFYCTFTSDNQWFPYLLLHEFGHSFSGLADEYYTSSTAYNEFYPKGVEPTEPNITALLDPAHVKWSHLVKPGTPIPTPWEKTEFDAMDTAYQKIRQEINETLARMKREGAPEGEIQAVKEKSERLSRENAEKADQFLASSKYVGVVGAYEGAGYSSEGLYRSEIDCLMFTKGAKPFCAACEEAVRRVIAHYTK